MIKKRRPTGLLVLFYVQLFRLSSLLVKYVFIFFYNFCEAVGEKCSHPPDGFAFVLVEGNGPIAVVKRVIWSFANALKRKVLLVIYVQLFRLSSLLVKYVFIFFYNFCEAVGEKCSHPPDGFAFVLVEGNGPIAVVKRVIWSFANALKRKVLLVINF